MLVLLTLLGIGSITTTTMEERMAANNQEITRAFQAASTGLSRVFTDEDAFATTNTEDSDGTVDDPYNKSASVGATGGNAYNATATYNSVFRQVTVPPRGSGWDNTYGFYHFDLSATGSTDSGAVSTIHAGAYQVGRAE
jgi:Tfp pilus assembly protein PilX